MKYNKIYLFCAIQLVAIITASAQANGVLRDGASARSMALAGIDSVSISGPIDALTGNPTGLVSLPDWSIQGGLGTAIVDAEFRNAANPNGVNADNAPAIIPDFAAARRFGRIHLGVGVSPVAAADVDWTFIDAAGGLGGVSFGLRRHNARFTALRGTFAAAMEITPVVSAGASLGVIYNENRLRAPYVFQNQSALQGLKTLVDLETDGFAVNGTFGVLLRPRDNVEVGLRYTTKTVFNTTGSLRGNADVQVPGLGPFRYDARLKTHLPAVASAAVDWQAQPYLKLLGQLDWIGWSNSFNTLPITLTNGNDAVLNGIVGADSLTDIAPLDWRDRFVIRAGVEYDWSGRTQLRAGYSYGKSPVPTGTLTPLTAAITEHSLSFGVGHRRDQYQIDFGYQWDIPNSETIGQSRLRAGEFNNSTLDVGIHWLTISVSFNSL
ncbi:MAG: outer membrane protein transport protein [Gammaproteobacteria bacterium]